MNRRKFVHQSAIGAVGFNLLNTGFQSSLFKTSGVKRWLKDYVAATDVHPRSTWFMMDESLRGVMKKINTRFAKSGFRLIDKTLYTYGSGNYCFYALILNHTGTDIEEMLLPVLHKDASGTWRHLTTFNGYQLEALAHASRVLKENAASPDAFLLPIAHSTSRNHSGGFYSHEGRTEIRTMVYAKKETRTTISISGSGGAILNETIRSGHCLNCAETMV